MMAARIIYLHQYFFTPTMLGVAGTRSYELGRRLVQQGHVVEMITSATRPPKNAPAGWYETTEAGMRVHWLPVPYSNRMPFAQRIRAFLRFALGSAWKALTVPGDVIYATSGPLTIAIPALLASGLRGLPLVFEVRDLWPEGAIQLGVLRNPLARFAARVLEWAAYHGSGAVVALSPGMKTGVVAAGFPAARVSVIPNACDLELFHPGVDGGAMRAGWGVEGKFVLGYFGTMGMANGLGFVLDAARVLKRRGVTDVVFLLQGDGMERPMLETRVRDENLDNVRLLPQSPRNEAVAQAMAAVDVSMTIFRNVPVLRTCSPNKLFDTFAAGKPALVNMPGWLQALVEDHDCGVFVRPDDPEDFADKVLALKNSPPERLAGMGRNARRLGERQFARDRLADQLGAVLKGAAGAPCPVI
jgi:glycosyltransferase involved in cell wall biosynthesis